MIRNLTLFLIAISLVTYIYYTEELAGQSEAETKLASEQIYDAKESGALLGFKGQGFSFSKSNQKFISKDKLPIDQLKVRKFFSELLNIKIQRVLKNTEVKDLDESLLIETDPPTLAFKFENNLLDISLGKKTQFNKTFYIRISKDKSQNPKWAIASYLAPYSAQLNEKEAHRSAAPYNQAMRLFNIKKENLLNYKVFEAYKHIDTQEVRSKRNKAYSIDFTKLVTTPKAPSGIEELKDRIDNYRGIVQGIEGLEVYREGELQKETGELIVNGDSFKFYGLRDGQSGYFVKAKNYIYKISSETFRVLFEPQQYFWKKNLSHGEAKNYEVFDKSGQLILSSDLTQKNTWSELLLSKAMWLSKVEGDSFDSNYKVKIGDKIYQIKAAANTVELLDTSTQVIFHFLQKIK